jgi:hypothetical protein
MLISETHFTDRSYFRIPQYTTYYTNHPDNTAHAGTAILIKNTIRHFELPKYEENHLQATVILVKMMPYDLKIASVYCPPRYNIKKEQFGIFFQTLGPIFIAGGDYNCKHTLWGSRLTTTKGRELANLIQERNYTFLTTGSPTYWPTDHSKIPDLLDFFITGGISPSYMQAAASYDLSSDHSPIIATISSVITHKKPPIRLHNKRTNWEQYRTEIEKNINLKVSLQNPTEVDDVLTNLTTTLIKAAEQATPTLQPYNRESNNISIEIKKSDSSQKKSKSQMAPNTRTARQNSSK